MWISMGEKIILKRDFMFLNSIPTHKRANSRLKMFARGKHSSLFQRGVNAEVKSFYNVDTRCQCYKTCFLRC